MAKSKFKYKRILLKLSGEILEGGRGKSIDFKFLRDLCAEILEIRELGVELAIVIGGGNIWRFRDFEESGLDRVSSDSMGMLATIMNGLAMEWQFKKLSAAAVTFSALSVPGVVPLYTSKRARNYLAEGHIIILSGGTGSPFFTTDSAAALRALELDCDILLKATTVDFVYDKDPRKHKDARKFVTLSYQEMFTRQLQVMDLSAVSLCLQKKLPIMVFNLAKRGNMKRAVQGENVGTLIS